MVSRQQETSSDYSSYFSSSNISNVSTAASTTDFQELVRHLTVSISEMDVLLRVSMEKEIMTQQDL